MKRLASLLVVSRLRQWPTPLQPSSEPEKPRMKAYGEQWYQFGMEQPRVATGPRTAHPRMKASGRRR